jgi:hypothetical protein
MRSRSVAARTALPRPSVTKALTEREQLSAAVALLVERFGVAAVAAQIRVACGDRSAEEVARVRAELLR